MLKDELESAKRLVNTDKVQLTIGEIATMYSNKELNISPDFQRLFSWSIQKKSDLIESILIGIPLPPVFVFETETGIWELIDGLQRVSTILEFMGVLRDVEDQMQTRRSHLTKTKYLPSLAGVVWEAQSSEEKGLENSIKLFFRRARLDFQVLKNPSSSRTKFDLFQRLNRGGNIANPQEIRSCVMVALDPEFTLQIRALADTPKVRQIFGSTEEQRTRQRDIQNLVRIMVHVFVEYDRNLDVEEYLDKGVVELIENNQQSFALDTLSWIIDTLWDVAGERALRPPRDTPDARGYRDRITYRALEVIAVGIGKNRAQLQQRKDLHDFVSQRISSFWDSDLPGHLSSAGTRGTTRIQQSVPFGKQWFDPENVVA